MVITLVQQIFSLFLMLGMGVLLVRFGGVRAEESRTLSALCIYVITPCVIIHAFQIEYTREMMQGFILAILLAAAAHLLMFLISFALQKPLQLTQVESLSIVYPNSGNLVIPLVAVILGSEWVIYASAFMSVQLFCIWTHGLSVISRQRKFDLQKILTNVNLLCVAGGFLLFLFQIKLPKVIDDTLASVSGMMGPVSMIMIGMMMAGICLTPIVKNRRIY